jgi:hypothetical protein
VRETGIDHHIPTTVTLDSSMDEIDAWARTLATTARRPDGFICPGEASYLAIRNALRSQGLRVGRDYAAVVKSISGILSQIDRDTDTIHEGSRWQDGGWRRGGSQFCPTIFRRLRNTCKSQDRTSRIAPATLRGNGERRAPTRAPLGGVYQPGRLNPSRQRPYTTGRNHRAAPTGRPRLWIGMQD